MVKERQERPKALIPARSCWAQRAWPSWELARFSQPSAPHEPSADCSHPGPSLLTDMPSLQGREPSGQLLSSPVGWENL